MSYRFAIVGCGKIAEKHADCIAHSGVLVAVCDTVPDRAKGLASKFGVTPYNSIDKMLETEKPDIVCVCSPNGLHAAHSIKALEHKAHVLCEKPMAINSGDAQAMCKAASANGKKLFVVKQNRFNPPVVLLKELISNHRLGRIQGFQVNCFWNRPAEYYQSDWHGTLELDGGTLYTQFSHFIDLVIWLFGNAKLVNGWRSNLAHQNTIEFEDNGVAFLQMQNGSTGSINYSINSFRKNMEGSLTVFGEKGTVKIGGEYLNRLDYFEVEGLIKPVLPDGPGANNYGSYSGSMSNHYKVYEELLNALSHKSNSIVEAEEALQTIDLIERIYQNSPYISRQSSKL